VNERVVQVHTKIM